ncbi:MAG: DUF805 domain-containing protein [Alphaproteobacteria bacterium]|nr:DUF805 domain-containing protein [Alphaproteobacteria bacterium]MBL6937557.1 DUF805 domain-containing protein [Alphaproteobacteria bacterium]MBL7098895.1 DUF805 domain-containing protein [Alphaproteobacteria bacterium]
MHYLFGFSGRINRAKIWLFILIVVAFWVVVGIGIGIVAAAQFGGQTQQAHLTPQEVVSKLGVVFLIGGIAYLLTLWMGLAVTTKRLHDRNKSAWWLLIFFGAPIVLNVPRYMALWHAIQDGTFTQLAQQGQVASLGGPVAIIAGGAATLISLWAFVELYCLAGTTGPNAYGADPLAKAA